MHALLFILKRDLFWTGSQVSSTTLLPPAPAVEEPGAGSELGTRDGAQSLPESRLYTKPGVPKPGFLEAFEAPFDTWQKNKRMAREDSDASRES